MSARPEGYHERLLAGIPDGLDYEHARARAEAEIAAAQALVYGVARDLRGHSLVQDPPAALTTMRRATCERCGRAVLFRPDGSTYGSATESDCPLRPARGRLVDCRPIRRLS